MTRGRIEHILGRLGLLTPDKVETILALLDNETPSGFRRLAKRGLPFAAGARTRQILDYIKPKLPKRRGKGRLDRELRDDILLPLRGVGILIKGLADTKAGKVIVGLWKPKSSNNVYVLNPDFLKLLAHEEEEFPDSVRAWETTTDERKRRIASAEAAALAANEDHRLVSIALSTYCPRFLPRYEVVFVDDDDGERIAAKWKEPVERLGLPLDLASRWPDIVLNLRGTNRCWIVDCVETDGEVDAVRREEILEDFRSRELVVDGFTTVYRAAKRFAERQSKVDNIAPGTYVWIAELGGAQFRKEPLSQP
jgi:hypothetical protein